MNERIFPASDVIKTHSVNPDAFQSPWWGPLGYVDGDEVIVRRLPAPRAQIAPERLGGSSCSKCTRAAARSSWKPS